MDLWDYVAYIKRGSTRKKVFLSLDKPMLPSEVVRKVFKNNGKRSSNTQFNLVSRALAELNERGLADILNPNEKTGRLYEKTELGRKVEKELSKLETQS